MREVQLSLELTPSLEARQGLDLARVRYIGSKARVVDQIMEIIGAPLVGEGVFVDAFCGTGVVGGLAADIGWPVRLNDTLLSAVTMAGARLVGRDTAPFIRTGGYEATLATLNELSPERGFVWKEYSPVSLEGAGVERRYFTEENAAKIDAIRLQIEDWHSAGYLSDHEYVVLLADLLSAVNAVANIAGTYGCFLRHWATNALKPLHLVPRTLRDATIPFETYTCDVLEVPIGPTDVVYFDPPYTKRQYAAYYHILETVAHGDEPVVEGITGLRPWRAKASDFSYKSRALKAIVHLLDTTRAARIYLSYSSEGHVPRAELAAALGELGDVTFHELAEIGRYRPNQAASAAASSVSEYLVELRKDMTAAEAA